MKYVIGWLRLQPGRRDKLLQRIRPFVAATLKEEGVTFFEVNPSDRDPDEVVFVESYASEEVHQRHLATPEHAALLADIKRMGVSGRFHSIYPERTKTDEFTF